MPKAPKPITPNKPLPNPKHEAFALAISKGMKLLDAYKVAGFEGKSMSNAWALRHSQPVAARIAAMLEERVKAQTRTFARRTKSRDDLLARAIRELEAIAFQDVREVANWRNEPKLNEAGEVIGVESTLAIRDSADLTPDAAKAVKGVFTKAGAIRLEMHDKRAALETLVKILSGSDAAMPAQQVTVNQVNIGSMSALDVARRVAFLLAKAEASGPPMIEARPVQVSEHKADSDKP